MNYDSGTRRVREILRPQSKLDFGKLNRLEVAFVVSALDPPIWSRQIGQLLGLPDNQIAAELSWLLETRALVELPSQHDRRRVYQAIGHPIWAYVREIAETRISESEDEHFLARYWEEICDGRPRAVPEGPPG